MVLTKKTVKQKGNKILLKSKDPFLTDQFLMSANNEFSGFKLNKVYSADEFAEVIYTSNIFEEDKKIVYVNALEPKIIDEFLPIMDNNSEDIFIFNENKTLNKNKKYTRFKSKCNYIKLDTPSDKDCVRWISSLFKECGIISAPDVPDFLFKSKGKDLYSLYNEVHKIAVVYSGKSFSLEEAKRSLTETVQANFFDFVDNFLHKRLTNTIKNLDKVNEYSYPSLISFLMKYIERVYKIACYREQKMEIGEISSIVSIPVFYIKTKYYTIINIFNRVKLLKIIDSLNDLEYKLRTSSLPHKVLFEAFILNAYKR